MLKPKTAIIAAIAGNLGIALTKFGAGVVTDSSAMLAEGIHSLVDTGNGILMLYGLSMSQKPPDDDYPFGHGKELYFWTLIVAILIFAVGGGMSVYEGIAHLLDPTPIREESWNYVVLSISLVFEAVSWVVAWGAFRSQHPRGIWRRIQASKDPTTYTVLLEDSVALLGIVIAMIGVFLAARFENPYFDGGASIVIGILLACVAVFLAAQSKGLLIGQGVTVDVLRGIQKITEADRSVERMKRPLTMYFGPHEVLLVLDVQFRKGLSAGEVTAAIDRIERTIRQQYPDITRIYIEAEALTIHYLDPQTV
jgi:cation diffusion facilitator family transporter